MGRRSTARCRHKHTGTLGWPITRPLPMNVPHASFAVCDRTECQDDANAAVRDVTGHDGVFVSYAEARARSGRAEPEPLALFPIGAHHA